MTFGKPIAGADLRRQFLSYFERQAHSIQKSSPLVPAGDATLLFTNAGMVQFKDVFTGKETRPYRRAATSQKCVRAGGKHNDLENVGRTARHHTFFEMLGNFSFGDYFKRDAIKFAWTFLTEELGIPKDRLSVTVFEGDAQTPPDTEAEAIWRDEIGVPAARITRHSAKDNFWQMGDTGPCGPCTEIHFDRGAVKGAFGGDDPEGDRVLEIWNLVFMQYERMPDRSLKPLPAPSVDTGMGLERLAMVMNQTASNYDTDLLRPLIAFSEERLKRQYTSSDAPADVAMRVIADHARTSAFLIADGVLPGNLSREYVLRSIMRRAVRFGDQLGFKDLFLHDAALRAVSMFESAYPELTSARALIEKVVQSEEDAFRRTLHKGLALYTSATSGFSKGAVIPGHVVFDLKATHGFPQDLTEQMAKEHGLSVDWAGFQAAEEKHAAASAGDLGVHGAADIYKALRQELGASTFLGYDETKAPGKVLALLKDGVRVQAASAGDAVQVVLDKTPFYGESGGQVGDGGEIASADARLAVGDTKKLAELHVHIATVKTGTLRVGEMVTGTVNTDLLERTRRNHSATHLLHFALRTVLGDHVTQKGSLVSADRLRFDFSHFEAVTTAQLEKVEDLVNDLVLSNHAADVGQMGFDDAKKKGAMALFGEKYGDRVRVVGFGPSVELCGGIHVRRTGDIGLFKVTAEGPLAAGVRRIEAQTGRGALEWVRRQTGLLTETARALKVADAEVPQRVERLQEALRGAERELEAGRAQARTQAAGDAVGQAAVIGSAKLLAQKLTDVDPKALRDYADKVRDKLGSGVVVLGLALPENKAALLVALTPDLVGKLHAGKLVGELAAVVAGKGGGKPDMAQAGGNDATKLDEALALARTLVERALAG